MKRWLWIPVWLLGLASTALAQETLYIGHAPKLVNITFESNADLEIIVGTCHAASGEIQADFTKGSGSVKIAVPVAALKTGIDMRDEHLRSAGWLDAEKFPNLSFESKSVKPVEGKPGQIEVAGDFTMHGVSKPLTLVMEWKELPAEAAKKLMLPEGKVVRFTGQFSVKLSDHGVKIPDMAGGKVADEVSIKLALFASTAKPEAAPHKK